MHAVDLTPIWQTVITLAAMALSLLGGRALLAVAAYFHIKVSTDQAALFETALNKGLAFGVVREMAMIRDKGWDHYETHSAITARALSYVIDREPAALAGVGLTPSFSNVRTVNVLSQALSRALPGALTVAAASPATPPPPAPIALLSPASAVPASAAAPDPIGVISETPAAV